MSLITIFFHLNSKIGLEKGLRAIDRGLMYIGEIGRRYSVHLTLTAVFLLLTHNLFGSEAKFVTSIVATAIVARDSGYILNVLTAIATGSLLNIGEIVYFFQPFVNQHKFNGRYFVLTCIEPYVHIQIFFRMPKTRLLVW